MSTATPVEESTAVATVEPTRTRAQRSYSSITGTDEAAKVTVFNAINNAKALSDHLGEPIALKDVIQVPAEGVDENTGEVTQFTRTVLIDADNIAYAGGSDALLGSLDNLFGVFGKPDTWTEPRVIRVVERKGKGNRKFYVVELGAK